MLPGTLLGFVLFIASLGPGYVYVRVAERHDPRPERSQLAEAVEMAIFGAVATTMSAAVILMISGSTGLLDLSALVERPRAYLIAEPMRVLATLLATGGASYALAWTVGVIRHREEQAVVHPGRTMWLEMLWHAKPSQAHSTIATVELRDGRTVVGMVGGFTAQDSEQRELALQAPLAARSGTGEFEPLPDTFLLIREDDILYLTGKYWPPDLAE